MLRFRLGRAHAGLQVDSRRCEQRVRWLATLCGQCINKEEDEKSVTWYIYFFAQEGERISAGRCSGIHSNRVRPTAIELAVDGNSAATRHTTSG